jgi:hypothetical protein
MTHVFMTPADEILHFYEQARAKRKRSHEGGIGSGAGLWLRRSMRPHWSDFICDVEIAAHSVLTPEEYRFLWVYHLTTQKSNHRATAYYKQESDRIIRIVTTEWIRQKIYPLARYFMPTHLQELVWVPDQTPIVVDEPKAGRPKKHKDRAAKQEAYRQRRIVCASTVVT